MQLRMLLCSDKMLGWKVEDLCCCRNEQLDAYWGKFAAFLEGLYEKIDKRAAPSTKA